MAEAPDTDVPTELADVIVVSNRDQDTDAAKVVNTMVELCERRSLDVSHLTPTDDDPVTDGSVASCAGDDLLGQALAVVLVVTTELLASWGRRLYDRVVSALILSKYEILVVKLNLDGELPAEIARYHVIDYNKTTDFSARVQEAITDWFGNTKSLNNSRFELKINIEVRPQKSRKAKNKAKELQKVRDTTYSLLQPDSPGSLQRSALQKLLLADYHTWVTAVQKNPLAFDAKIKGDEFWQKLQHDCENQSLAEKFMPVIKDSLERSQLVFKLKLVFQKKSSDSSSEKCVALTTQASPERLLVVSRLLFAAIADKDHTAADLGRLLRQYGREVALATLSSDPDAYSLLTAAVVHRRDDLLHTLVEECPGLWQVLMEARVPVTSPSSYRGHSAMQVADSRKSKKTRTELVKCNQLVNSMGRFLRACHAGDQAAVERQLETDPGLIRERDCDGHGGLYWALVADAPELFTLLLARRGPAEEGEEEEPLLHAACRLGGRERFIPTLLERCGADAMVVAVNKKTPLDHVAENGDVATLRELLRCDVSVRRPVLPPAAAYSRTAFIKYVLEESGLPAVDVNERDADGFTALNRACEKGADSLVNYLLGKGASVLLSDRRRRGPLHHAAKCGSVDLARSLLALGAEVDARDVYTGQELCFLIRGKDRGRPAWHYVEVRRSVVHVFMKRTRSGQVDVAQYGTVVKSGWGEDPAPGIVDWIEKMFSDRAGREAAAGDMTPLHMALYRQHPQVAALLVERGADVNAADLFGLTPLMYCAIRNDIATATLLASKGAKLDARDCVGNSALEIAKLNEHLEMANYIEGVSYMDPIERFVLGPLEACHEALAPETVEGWRGGDELRRYAVDQLRSLMSEVNQALVGLGAGPVTRPEEDDHAMASFSSTVVGSDWSGASMATLQSVPLTTGDDVTTPAQVDEEERGRRSRSSSCPGSASSRPSSRASSCGGAN